jgi:hypothetical protein
MATEDRPDPFGRDVDRLLEGLRWHCQPDPYKPIPGQLGHWSDDPERRFPPCGPDPSDRFMPGGPDRWAAKCPLHPNAGLTLLITENCAGADVWCAVGCPPSVIRYVLLPDAGRDREAARRAGVLVWARNYRRAAA